MQITFLGHQGWQFEHHGRGFLLDPILVAMGNGSARLPIWPQRRLDFAKFGPLDAVIISHEHADHFSLETLAALPKQCPIYISDLSSLAMGTAIAELGFKVERFPALRTFTISGIKITALPGLYNTLEPDTYALLMQDASGASFLTAIDTVAHPDVCGWLLLNCPNRTLDNLTNNFVEPRAPLVEDESSYTKSRSLVAGNMLDFVQKFSPRRAVVSGQGWSFQGAKAQLNHTFFSVDNRWLTQTARELAPHVDWFEGAPGMRFHLNGDEIAVDQSDAIGTVEYPNREFKPRSVQGPQPYVPWSGVNEIPTDRLRALHSFICEKYGQILEAHAPRLMERLYYLKWQAPDNVVPAFAVMLRNGNSRRMFALDYGHLNFHEVPAATRCAVGFEIWAADLEMMVAAQEEVFMIWESAVRPWSLVPESIETSSLIESFMWFTPRFRPQEFLAFYRSQIAALKSDAAAAAR